MRMNKRQITTYSGFNLVEMLVAGVILSASVVTVGAISTHSLNATHINRQYEQAASVVDKILRMIDYTGIDAFLEKGQTEGYEEDIKPGYQWRVTTQYLEVDRLYRVTITVTWMDRGRMRQITVDTELDGIGSLVMMSTHEPSN
jgi:hypothetical protein